MIQEVDAISKAMHENQDQNKELQKHVLKLRQ